MNRLRGQDDASRQADVPVEILRHRCARASWARRPPTSATPVETARSIPQQRRSTARWGCSPSATENDVISTDEGKGGSEGVALAWSGKLGKPVLAGTRATYAEVQPGVDLVGALRTGYEQFLIIKTPAALTALTALTALSGDGTEVSWSLPVKTKGLTARAEPDGSVSFVDAKNVVASQLAAPKAWDAVVDPKSGERSSAAPVKLSVVQKGIGKAVVTMTPDQVWLNDPARVFPITIDPTYASANVGTIFDTYVSKQFPISIPWQKPVVSGQHVSRGLPFDDPERVLFQLVVKQPVVGDELSEVAF